MSYPRTGRPVVQAWVEELTFMQQTVLLTAVRGPDGVTKYHPVKNLLRWYRRCLLISAMDGAVLTTPGEAGGGSFTGPSYTGNENLVATWEDIMHSEVISEVLRKVDELPHHFYMHLVHAIEIMGYKHSDDRIRSFWLSVYLRFCKDMHVNPETVEQMDHRLGDSREQWLQSNDPATST